MNDITINMPADIDILPTQKSVIDLTTHNNGDFGLQDYKLSFIFDDIILVKYIDLDADDGDLIKRGSIFVQASAVRAAWRKAEVVLVGPNVKYTKIGDIVIFPNDKGITVANIEVEGYGLLKKGMFLNEQRIFGICKPITANVSN